MRKSLFLLFLPAVQILAAASTDLIIADQGKSAYKIVYADSYRSP